MMHPDVGHDVVLAVLHEWDVTYDQFLSCLDRFLLILVLTFCINSTSA